MSSSNREEPNPAAVAAKGDTVVDNGDNVDKCKTNKTDGGGENTNNVVESPGVVKASSTNPGAGAAPATVPSAILQSSSPSLTPITSRGSRSGPLRPALRHRPPSSANINRGKKFFSTDDDEEELEADRNREYQEYSDELQHRMRRVAINSPILAAKKESLKATSSGVEHPTQLQHKLRNVSRASELDNFSLPSPSIIQEEEEEGANHGDEHYDEDNDDMASVSSIETFTLRERQDAINTTHPFGIRIWKPAIYKKIRSVQKLADGDIHSTPGKQVPFIVLIGNVLWTIFFGSLFLILCTVASSFCMILFWSNSAADYGRTFFSLGTYLFIPFGKYVELSKIEEYWEEDEGEGRPLSEYLQWHTGSVEAGKLFFGPKHSDGAAHASAAHGSSSAAGPSRSASGGAATENNADTSASNTDSTDHTAREENDAEDSPLLPGGNQRKRRFFGRGKWTLGRIVFFAWYYALIAPFLYLVSLICFLGVFSIPMGKVTSILAYHLRRHPLSLSFKPASAYSSTTAADASETSILLCTYRAFGINYYKYTIDGTNIFFINLLAGVIFVILNYYILHEYLELDIWIAQPSLIFVLSLLSVIPLAYFLGQAVASISAQTSMGMGAAINAFFSTIVEVFLYTVALQQGKGILVEGSIIGSILAAILLLPGLSMCAGALIRKTQRYNPNSAGVSSTMLMFAVIGTFAPTVFYQIYGTYELRCGACVNGDGSPPPIDQTLQSCRRCEFYQVPLSADNLFRSSIQPFSYCCAVLLFISYVIGLWFTLRTHAAMIWNTATPAPDHRKSVSRGLTAVDGEQGPVLPVASTVNSSAAPAIPVEPPSGGHDAPNWSRTKSTVILLAATLAYAIIAEILVDTVDVVLANISISQKLLGITIFALVPNTTEFLNAISFAMQGNIALSMEIGSAYAVQVCLLQVPALVLYSIWSNTDPELSFRDFNFTLVFPRWDLFIIIFCVFLFSYIYAEGKSNYFKGSILILTYIVAALGFYFADLTGEDGIMSTFIIP